MISRHITAVACSVLAIGLVACGGGGGDSGGPANTPPADSKAKIDDKNAKQVTQSAAKSANASSSGADLGKGAFDTVDPSVINPSVPVLPTARSLAIKAIEETGGTETCAGGGTINFAFEDFATAPGDLLGAIVVTAANCVDEGVTSNGVMRLSDLQLDADRIGATIAFDSFSVADPSEQVNGILKGTTTFLIETTRSNTQKTTFGVRDLQVNEGGVLSLIPRLDTVIEVDSATNVATTSIGGTLNTPQGVVDLVTEKPFVSLGDLNPTAGQLKIVGELSSVTLVPRLDGETVDLQIDTADADPGLDVITPATWDEVGPLF